MSDESEKSAASGDRRASVFSGLAVVLAAGLLAATVGPLLHRPAESGDLVPSAKGICHELGRRASAQADRGPRGFMAHLARACRAAQASLGHARGPERRRSETLLERLAALEAVLSGMETARARAAAADPLAWPPRPLSASGTFLVARELGVLAALDAWRESAPMTLAGFP